MSIKDLLAVLDMSEEEQCKYFWKNTFTLYGGELRDCVVGDFWVGGQSGDIISGKEIKLSQAKLADLAFRLNGGSLANKKPIEWVVDALIKEEKSPEFSCSYRKGIKGDLQ